METNLFFAGFLLMLLGGTFLGTFSFPLKYTPKWKWENTWGAGSLMALLILPWPLALLTVPRLGEVYASVPASILILALLFGAGWGIGGIFYGKGLDAIGFSVGMAIIMGIIAIGGSVIPLAMTQPEVFVEVPGLVLLGGIVVMIIGLMLCARAGLLKERDQSATAEATYINKTTFKKGLLLCVLAGLLSSLVNFGFIFGTAVSQAAVKMGAVAMNAENAILALVFTSNFLVNIIFCAYLTIKNKTFSHFKTKGTGRYWLMAALMGVIWPGGIIVYGMGTTMIGELGAYLGFPVMLIVSIIAGNVFGILTGEWKGTTKKPKWIMGAGIFVLCLAIVILGFSMSLA